jgi:hypothetical protein
MGGYIQYILLHKYWASHPNVLYSKIWDTRWAQSGVQIEIRGEVHLALISELYWLLTFFGGIVQILPLHGIGDLLCWTQKNSNVLMLSSDCLKLGHIGVCGFKGVDQQYSSEGWGRASSLKNGQLTCSHGTGGKFAVMHNRPPFQVRVLFYSLKAHTFIINFTNTVYFSPLQVKITLVIELRMGVYPRVH